MVPSSSRVTQTKKCNLILWNIGNHAQSVPSQEDLSPQSHRCENLNMLHVKPYLTTLIYYTLSSLDA